MPRRDSVEEDAVRAIRERAEACGASVVVNDGEAGGVEVLVRLPWTV